MNTVLRLGTAAAVCAILAACSGGGGSVPGDSPTKGGTPTPTPAAATIATPMPTAAATAPPTSTAVPTATPVPTAAPTATATSTPTATPVPTTTPTPTTAPTATPTLIVANPASISPPANSTAAVSLAISETNYTGVFTESDDCAALATVTPPSTPRGPSATYSVQPQAGKAGNCTITLADANGQNVQVNVTLTTVSVVVK